MLSHEGEEGDFSGFGTVLAFIIGRTEEPENPTVNAYSYTFVLLYMFSDREGNNLAVYNEKGRRSTFILPPDSGWLRGWMVAQ